MENYIVSARKYRPTTFESVVGQSALTTTLRNAIANNKLAHAYLFCGPRGVGKTTCARIFAKTINCQSPTESGEACGHCESCKAFDEGRSYNIHELDAASNNSVDDMRSLIEQVAIPPQIGRYKVFIIDEVHMLSTAAFNAFLKTLEEPPSHAIFILATTEKHKIIPTILSRCQIYDFNRMSVDDIVAHLRGVAEKEGIPCEEEALNVIARKADGGMRDALSMFDQIASYSGGNITYQKAIENLNVLDYDYYFRVTDQLLEGKVKDVLLTLNEILAHGFNAQFFIGGLATHFRDILVARDAETLPLLEVAPAVRAHYQEQAKRCTPRFLYRALKLCNDCDINYRQSPNRRLLVELTLIEVAQLSSGDDDKSSGLGPTKKLKPIFGPAAQKQQVPQAAPASASTQPVAAPEAATPVSPATPVAPTTHAAPAATPAPVRNTHKSSRLQTVSLHAAQKPKEEPAPVAMVSEAEEETYGNAPVTSEAVEYHWLVFANALPVEYSATSGRLKIIKPVLGEGGIVRAYVETENVLADMNEIKSQLEHALRKNLDNGSIVVQFELNPEQVARRAYTKREQLADMLQRSPALQKLKKELKLELA